MITYAYYPGCVAQESGKELDDATKFVAKKLDINLIPMPEASCCGGGVIDGFDKNLKLFINGRTLALAEKEGLDILTICNTCTLTLSEVNEELINSSESLNKTNEYLAQIGLKYSGKVKIKHLLYAIRDDIGFDNLRKKAVRSLKGVNIAPFYGCHILRPSNVVKFDDVENPQGFEELIKALSGEPVSYARRTKCCGFQTILVNEATSTSLAGNAIFEAQEKGADVMVTPCPLCHLSLDTYQTVAARSINKKLSLPITHLPQLIGIALGGDYAEMGFSRHNVSLRSVIAKVKQNEI
ncbi:MAG: CoB--CoM heterodisulfide reductase iron-sulfur subunit B family protein [Deltaproteobacteria bacterium]|nr:CoB--CoM heterodisulfide reductase iron-sulfur subunit B family protein [Deltaproteobacteria bacterium]